ncbi:hypothetical protein CBR_g39679 [Chara braunii]|uniref:RNA-directed DNA polymerase n=1 Tax=Chara braunii TaxID=69332 RepID=A0A388LSD6_CHABU|nr:hypothetical protein CBR_g39679 [Chara braunii]|eukprot:GBG85112.1 hypothetical protein CBR_g39679 [Chara braunii]
MWESIRPFAEQLQLRKRTPGEENELAKKKAMSERRGGGGGGGSVSPTSMGEVWSPGSSSGGRAGSPASRCGERGGGGGAGGGASACPSPSSPRSLPPFIPIVPLPTVPTTKPSSSSGLSRKCWRMFGKVRRKFMENQTDGGKSFAFNPELLTTQKRQWHQLHRQLMMEEEMERSKKEQEEMERRKKEQEEKMAAIQAEEEEEKEEVEEEEEERLLERRRGGSTSKEAEIAERAQEWAAHLKLGEDQEAEMAVPEEEREAARRQIEAERDPVKRGAKEEQRMAWRHRLSQERIRRLEAAERADKDLRAAKVRMGKIRVEIELATKLDTLIQSVEALLVAQREQMQYERSQDIKIDAIRAGFKDFACDMMKHVLTEVHIAINRTREFCTGAIEDAKLAAPKEEELAPPRREKVKVRFPEPFSGKKGEDFDNWEAIVHSYLEVESPTPHISMAEVAGQRLVSCPEIACVRVSLGASLTGLVDEQRERRQAWAKMKKDSKGQLILSDVEIFRARVGALIDSGATRSYISRKALRKLKLNRQVQRLEEPVVSILADNSRMRVEEYVEGVHAYFRLEKDGKVEKVLHSLTLLVEVSLPFDVVLGTDWGEAAGATLHLREHECTLPSASGEVKKVHMLHESGVDNPLAHCCLSAPAFAWLVRKEQLEEQVFVAYVRPVFDQPKEEEKIHPAIASLLEEYKDLSEPPSGVVPRPIQHRIEIEPGSRTPKGAVYRMSPKELEELRRQLDELLEKGWIRPSSSPFGAPVLFVPKKEGELRMCIDYRGLNAITIKNAQPLPRIDDLLDRVQGCRYFSKIDLKSGYHQIEVHPDDQYKTAFRTRYGHYEFIVMPFGLTNAPATFQRCMNDLFRPWLDRFVVVYLDDILVFSKTLEEHEGHLRQILIDLRNPGLEMKDTAYTKEDEEKMAAILQERKEKEAKKKALKEEQAAKLKKIEEEMAREKERIQKEEEEKLKEVEEEEEDETPLQRKKGQYSGSRDEEMEKRISEWTMEDEKRMEWRLAVMREKKRRVDAAAEAAEELEGVKKIEEQLAVQTELPAQMRVVARNVARQTRIQAEQYDFSRSQHIAVRSIRLGFRDFACELVGAVGTEVGHRLDKTERFCAGAIEGVKAAAPKEEEACPPCREPVKVKFPDSYSGKRKENFDNWEANVKTYVHLQQVSPDQQVLIVIHALRDEAASFARSLVRAANCSDDPVAYSSFTSLTEFLKLLRERFADVARSVKASDKLQMIHARKWKSARALKSTMDELIAVPDHGVTDTQLVALFYRAMPEAFRGNFFAKSEDPATTYDSLSREVVAFEAKSMSVSTFWLKDLDKGKQWKGRTISRQVKTKDSLVLTLDEGSVDEIPHDLIEWGLEEDDSGAYFRLEKDGRVEKVLHSLTLLVEDSLPFDIVLGMDWGEAAGATLHLKKHECRLPSSSGEAKTARLFHVSGVENPLAHCCLSAPAFARLVKREKLEEHVFVAYVRPVTEPTEERPMDPAIAKLLEEFKDLIEPPTGTVPRPIQHRIKIEPGSRTLKGAVYRMSPRELEELRKQLDELLEKGWIWPSSSLFGAPVLFVPKKEGELRMCIDYRGLNAITVKNAEPLPRIDDLLDQVQGAKYFSKIDLKFRYHQIEVHPDDQYKTAFRTRYGHYEFIVMPFGLTNATTTFQRCMNDLFRPWLDKFVVVYLDDILVFSKTLDEHQGHLRQVLEKLREANFKINAKKCDWAKTQVLYLGHVLDGDDVKPEDSKIVAIRDWPTPRTVTELRSFLGLANYYRKFVRNFSTITAPLCRLLRKETIWKWDKDCTSAMKKLKPVEFMSARMPSKKVATSTYERELYAHRQALEHWKHYLLGRHFKVNSDHETLRWLKTQAKMTPKLTRWAAEIDQYDFELKPVKGKYNVVADALSRRADYFGAIVHYLDIGRDLQQKIREAYAQDPIYSDLLKRVKEALETEPNYHTTEGLLFEKTNLFDRLCIPNSEEIRSLILGECHDTEGHFGWQKTLANLMRAYTWPGMKNDCVEYVRSCKVCQRNKSSTRASLGLLRPLPITDQPGDSVSIDFMDTQVKSRHGCQDPVAERAKGSNHGVGEIVSKSSMWSPLISATSAGHIQLSSRNCSSENWSSGNWSSGNWSNGNCSSEHCSSGATVDSAAVETAAVDTAAVETATVDTAGVETATVDAAGVETAAVKTAVAADEQAGAGRENRGGRSRPPAGDPTTVGRVRGSVSAGAWLQQQQTEASQNQVRYQATMELANEEATYRRVLRQQHFQANEEQEEPTEEERSKEAIAVLMENVLYTCNWQQRELLAVQQIFIHYETTFRALEQKITALQTVNSDQQAINDQLQTTVNTGLARLFAVESTGNAAADCSPTLAAQAKQLEERINHVVASLGAISKFARTSPVSNQLHTLSDHVQQRTTTVVKEWKMPNFKIEKFDDYHMTGPLQWWMAFNAEADVHHVPPLRRLDSLYLQLIGGAQAFMTHMAVTLDCTIATLHTKISWEEFEKKWKTWFMVNNDKRHAPNTIFRIFQGQQTSREWLTEWQRLATPE